MVLLSDLLSELQEVTRNSATGEMDNSKRTRAINRVLQDLRLLGIWIPARRTKTFTFTDGDGFYSLETDVDCVCLHNDGATEIPDFVFPYDLRLTTDDGTVFTRGNAKDVRKRIAADIPGDEYAIDGDTLIINYSPASTTVSMDFEYYSKALVKTTGNVHKLEFNADAVTTTDKLIDDAFRSTVIEGAKAKVFSMIGGKNEAERRDAEKRAGDMYLALRKAIGYPIPREQRILNFPGSH